MEGKRASSRGKETMKRRNSSSKRRSAGDSEQANSSSPPPASSHPSTVSAATDKSANQPVKVVYISNPMKVNSSASDFQALVHGLTGKDSDWSDNCSKLKIPAGCELPDNTLQTVRNINDGSGSSRGGQHNNNSSENYGFPSGVGEETAVADDIHRVSQPFEGLTGVNDSDDGDREAFLIDDDQHLRRQMYFDDFYSSMPVKRSSRDDLFK